MPTEIAPRIVIDPDVRFGKPIVQGTRVTVGTVIAELAGGMTLEEVAEEYALSSDDIRAALGYAAQLLASAEVRLTS